MAEEVVVPLVLEPEVEAEEQVVLAALRLECCSRADRWHSTSQAGWHTSLVVVGQVVPWEDHGEDWQLRNQN